MENGVTVLGSDVFGMTSWQTATLDGFRRELQPLRLGSVARPQEQRHQRELRGLLVMLALAATAKAQLAGVVLKTPASVP